MISDIVSSMREEDWGAVLDMLHSAGVPDSKAKKQSTTGDVRACGDSTKDFESILDRIEGMRGTYGFSDADWRRVSESLSELRRKNADEYLYLGIVGEFSSGKSTLINALLGAEILKEDVLQGTTCAPTLLRYGPAFDVEVRLLSGKILRYSEEFPSVIVGSDAPKNCVIEAVRLSRDFIDRYTADERYSRSVQTVTICLPFANALFENKVVIVDTPGINADNPRHQEVTEKAIREICDTVIVLTQATIPCSQTLTGFVERHLAGMTENCICVASQIDLLRRRERDHQLKFIASRFASMGIEFRRILGLAAYYVEHPEEKPDNEDVRQLRQEFAAAQDYLAQELKADRQRVIAEKLSRLLRELLNERVKPLVEGKTSELRERHDKLTSSQLYDFDLFLKQVRSDMGEAFYEPTVCDGDIRECVRDVANELKNLVNDAISACDSKDEVSAIFSGRIQAIAAEYQQNSIAPFVMGVNQCFDERAVEILEAFHADFNDAFRDLAGDDLALTIQTDAAAGRFEAGLQFSDFSANLATIKASEEAKKSGAFGGAAVGMMVAGPLGAVVGVALGWLGSELFGPPLDAVKREARQNANRLIDDWQASVVNSALQAVYGHAESVKTQMFEYVGTYSKYRKTVRSIIAREKAEQDRLEALIASANDDLKFLSDTSRKFAHTNG